jgi:hypothetical protein
MASFVPSFLKTALKFILPAILFVPSAYCCVTCHDFSTLGSGWNDSPQAGTPCSPDYWDCYVTAAPRPSFAETLHPGIFTRQENGHVFISGVVQASQPNTLDFA